MNTLLIYAGELFAQCPVDSHPGVAVESVMDSSRYFVLRIKDDSGKDHLLWLQENHIYLFSVPPMPASRNVDYTV